MDLLTANDEPGRYPKSYYASATELLPEFSPAKGALTCDVCVVGGGFSGLSAALHLADRGYSVVLLEAQRIGFGASGRNGGQVGTGQRRDQDDLEKIVGPGPARALWDIALDAVSLVRDLCADPDVNCQFSPGIVHADHRARYVAESFAYAEKLNRDYGYDGISALDRAGVRDLVASDAYFGGTLDTGAGHVDPLRFAFGLARKAVAAGVTIHERSRVTSMTRGAKVIVSSGQATVEADHAIIACNGYLGSLDKSVAAHVMPINNFIIATEPFSASEQDQLIANNFAVADSKFVVNYFRFSEDRRLLFGGTESYGYRFPNDIAAKVRKPMLDIFPQLDAKRIDFAWGGSLAITMNRMPYFALVSQNVLTLGGYSGHGVAMATMGGKIAADAIAGQAERFDVMAQVPTPRFPGGATFRWPLLVLAMLWYSLRDRF